jgi:type III secretion protein J
MLMLGVLALSACSSNVELFSAANEIEANEILSVLLDRDIPAQKVAGKNGISISVSRADVAKALDILRTQGLPRERFDGMGRIFRKDGLISSPMEERARYVYALSQELTNTLSQMDGVLVARVHVVLPEQGGVNNAPTRATAGVFIKHQSGYNLDALKPQIRALVMHAIPGLSDDGVSIALVSAQPRPGADAEQPAMASVLGIKVAKTSAYKLTAILALLVLLVLTSGAAAAWLSWRHGRGGGRERLEDMVEPMSETNPT